MKTLAKWSVGDYHPMIEAGILGDRPVELLAGEVSQMSPETPIHYNTTKRGTKYLEELLASKADVRFNGEITRSDSESEPDIAIVRLPESAYNDRHPEPQDLFWVVEVSQTRLKKDLELKAAIYASAAIQEYWVLNLSAKQMIVFRSPQNGEYTTELTIDAGSVIPLVFPDIRVSVERLLG
ncbi:MAG: Uma2 family endonuclease [Microcoleus sp.]